MSGTPLHALVATAGLALAACAHSAPPAKEAAMPAAATSSARMMLVKEWPLRFKSHKFAVFTYDTYGAKVVYADLLQTDDDPNELQPSSASYGPDFQRNWSGTHSMIRNFPSPAKVSWRSKDGQGHEAEIDVGKIFADEVIRHHVSREEIADLPDGEYQGEPSIILEINDRTIRVWMRAHVSTKELQKPDNRYSDFRNDLVLVETYTY